MPPRPSMRPILRPALPPRMRPARGGRADTSLLGMAPHGRGQAGDLAPAKGLGLAVAGALVFWSLALLLFRSIG
jgi:hypothetical protein